MAKGTKICSRCGFVLAIDMFHYSNTSADGCQPYCKTCKQDYYREYIVPALRGRGNDHVLPAWLKTLVKPPLELPGKVIRLADYIDPASDKKIKRLVVGL